MAYDGGPGEARPGKRTAMIAMHYHINLYTTINAEREFISTCDFSLTVHMSLERPAPPLLNLVQSNLLIDRHHPSACSASEFCVPSLAPFPAHDLAHAWQRWQPLELQYRWLPR